MNDELIYLAIPYSHPSDEVRNYRLHLVSDIAGKLMNEGKVVFSPISHGDTIAKIHNLPTDWEYWEKSCKSFVSRSTKVIVVMANGWDKSKGVSAEIKLAEQLGIPVEYYSVDDNPIGRFYKI
jgi:hypothetical protein